MDVAAARKAARAWQTCSFQATPPLTAMTCKFCIRTVLLSPGVGACSSAQCKRSQTAAILTCKPLVLSEASGDMFRQGGQSTAIVSQGRRKIHTSFPDGSELVEEYDVKTGELVVRKRRAKSTTGREGSWEYLVGEAPATFNPSHGLLAESSQNPVFVRLDTRDAFQWRLRNLPYPANVYSVTVDETDRKVVVRTSNKKYYKRFSIPELDLLSLPLQPEALTWNHAHNTLIISYAKPHSLREMESHEVEAARKLRPEDGEVDCKQQ